MSAAPRLAAPTAANEHTSLNKNSLVDDIDEAAVFAQGIETAIRGLECMDRSSQEGVAFMSECLIERLRDLSERANKMDRERKAVQS